jgi:pyruvate/2-oxoglutarate dehydrogenase complex dihydrolipoamide acyltransferase (E2) component
LAVELKLEPVSEEQEYGTIARWHKREGDAVSRGEVIVEVEAEKVTQEVESPVAGVLESILAVEGDEIRVGAVIAVIAEPGAEA